jgi:hypothetical protein
MPEGMSRLEACVGSIPWEMRFPYNGSGISPVLASGPFPFAVWLPGNDCGLRIY